MKKISLSILLLVVCIGLFAAANNEMINISDTTRDPSQTSPYNLMAAVIGNNDVLLIWENPIYVNLPMGYRIYCNNVMVQYIAGVNITDFMVEDVCGGCHQFYVTAYFDTGCESAPSNIAEITITSNADNVLAETGLGLKLYPNPSRSHVSISLSGLKFGEDARIAVFNVKGQKIRQINLSGIQAGLWDGKDVQGRKVSEGIYYLKATTSQGSVTRKVIMVR